MRSRTIAFFLIASFALYEVGVLRWFDTNFCQEKIKNVTGRWLFREDWSNLMKIDGQLDYSWLDSAGNPILVAHALGASGLASQNTLAEMENANHKGVKLMEIDLWLDEDDVLRCHHGPDQPAKYKNGECKFEDALKLAVHNGSWLVLDIKTDFTKTGDLLVERVNPHLAQWVIFQLYKPEHIEHFSKWHRTKPFAGPIVTLYQAHRSIDHINKSVISLGIKALTIPIHRLPALNNEHRGIKIFTHPVHDCDAFGIANKFSADGLYVTNYIVDKIRSACH